jgi:transcription antitermination factor NusA-like protein
VKKNKNVMNSSPILDITGRLLVSTENHKTSIEFKKNQVFIDVGSNDISIMKIIYNMVGIRKNIKYISNWLNEKYLTITITANNETLLVIGRNAKPSKIISMLSGSNIEIRNFRNMAKLLKGELDGV